MNLSQSEELNVREMSRATNLLDHLVLLARHKKFIIRFVLICCAAAAFFLFLILPRWYKSVAVVMPPQQKNAFGLLSSITRATSSLRSLGMSGMTDDLSQFRVILASRRVMESVVEHFDLEHVYHDDSMEKALKTLEGNCSFSPGKEDISLEIAVFDTDPRRAADMANFFVESLNKAYHDMSVTEATSNRQFLEKRYLQNLSDLRSAEDSLKEFQQRTGVYSVTDQVKAAVQVASLLETQARLKKVQVDMLARTMSKDNPIRQEAELEYRELQNQLSQMKTGGELRNGVPIFPAFKDAPEIGMEYLRHYREVEIQGKLLELLLPLYEQAKIEEQKNTLSVVVLDYGVPADRPSKPQRMLTMLMVFVGSLLVAYFIALSKDKLASVRSGADDKMKRNLEFIREQVRLKRLFR